MKQSPSPASRRRCAPPGRASLALRLPEESGTTAQRCYSACLVVGWISTAIIIAWAIPLRLAEMRADYAARMAVEAEPAEDHLGDSNKMILAPDLPESTPKSAGETAKRDQRADLRFASATPTSGTTPGDKYANQPSASAETPRYVRAIWNNDPDRS